MEGMKFTSDTALDLMKIDNKRWSPYEPFILMFSSWRFRRICLECLYTSWSPIYTIKTDIMKVDQGSICTIARFSAMAPSPGIQILLSGVESHNYLGAEGKYLQMFPHFLFGNSPVSAQNIGMDVLCVTLRKMETIVCQLGLKWDSAHICISLVSIYFQLKATLFSIQRARKAELDRTSHNQVICRWKSVYKQEWQHCSASTIPAKSIWK